MVMLTITMASSEPCHCVVLDTPGMALFLKNVAFHGILLDALFEENNQEWEEVYQQLKEGITQGVVQPLKTTVFERGQVEEAFRFMAQGKHIGKVVLQVSLTSDLNPSYYERTID